MPASFKKCINNGGYVITKKPSRETYRRVCYKNGNAYAGELKRVKSQGKKSTMSSRQKKKMSMNSMNRKNKYKKR